MKAPTWLPPVVAASVFAVALAAALLPGRLPTAGAAATGPATLPARIADYSYLTGDVSAGAPGRAVAIWQHGFGVEFLDLPQAVMLGADGDVYRRIDLAERRAGSETQGDPAAMLLSPDGTRVAVGDYVTSSPDLAVVDLTTGREEGLPVPGGRSAVPLAWSPDSQRVAYLSTAEPMNPYSGTAISGEIGVLDVATGVAGLLPGPANVRAAAFSPDGSELAIHRITPDDGSLSGQDGIPRMSGGTIDVVDADGTVLRELAVPEDHYLDGPDAWSPDGALLATAVAWVPRCDHLDPADDAWAECYNSYEGSDHGIVFLDASGQDGAVPAPIPADAVGWDGLIGWAGTGEPLFLDVPADPENADTDLYWLTAVPLDGGEPQPLSAVPGGGNFGVGGFQLATALLPDLEIREPGEVDRGPLPIWLGLVVAVAAGGLALLVTRGVVRVAGRRSSSTPTDAGRPG